MRCEDPVSKAATRCGCPGRSLSQSWVTAQRLPTAERANTSAPRSGAGHCITARHELANTDTQQGRPPHHHQPGGLGESSRGVESRKRRHPRTRSCRSPQADGLLVSHSFHRDRARSSRAPALKPQYAPGRRPSREEPRANPSSTPPRTCVNPVQRSREAIGSPP
jgi:hypothetical protein